MPFELLAQYLNLPIFAAVAGRIGGIVMFQPLLGALIIPVHVRIVFVMGLAFLATPLARITHGIPDSLPGLVLAVAGEILLGVFLGMIVRTCFLGLEFAGMLLAQESGLAFGQIADPTSGQEQSVLSMIYIQVATVVFLIIGGHRELIRATLDTFTHVPLLSAPTWINSIGDVLFGALTAGLEIGVRIAAPTIITLFLVNVALGFVARTVPQINVATVGFAMKGMIAFVLMAISLPAAMEVFTGGLQLSMEWIEALTGGG